MGGGGEKQLDLSVRIRYCLIHSCKTKDHVASNPRAERAQRGIQSIEVGGALLLALAHHGRPMALKDLAQSAGMSAAKAHPYLVSFGKLGLIAQDGDSGRYGLGPLAMQLGLISLQQVDALRLATPLIAELAQHLQLTMAIAVWGNRGATIVRVEEAPTAVHVAMRHGTVLSLRGTASGLLFAAHLSPTALKLALADDGARADAALRTRLAQIRAAGLASVVDGALPGVSAMAAPVWNARGGLELSLTAIGPNALFDTAHDGVVAQSLRAAAVQLTATLGGRPPPVQ
jgi:DNA-binding IclR family transcriptional regulator